MDKPTCSVPDCSNAVLARGFCNRHYKRFRTYGNPERTNKRVRPSCRVSGCESPHKAHGYCGLHNARIGRHGTTELPSRVRSVCSVVGCDKTSEVRGWCNGHYLRVLRYGDPLIDRTVRGSDSPQWIGDNISYFGLHVRIKVDRGRAAEHDCVDCGGQAAEWSYDHTGVDEKVSDTGMAYSTDTAQYSPRCKPCHGAFDSAQRASA